MFATVGIAKPDHLDTFFGMKNSVLATISGYINPLRRKEFGGGLRPASGEADDSQDPFHDRKHV